MAFAWLLVSPVALEHCESVLASVFYPDDFEKAFGGGVPEGGVEESADGILLCLSAIEVNSATFFSHTRSIFCFRSFFFGGIEAIWVFVFRSL